MTKTKLTYSKKDTQINNLIYQSFLNLSYDDGWKFSAKTDNFNEFMTLTNDCNIHLENHTILDVGCGTGDLAGFLAKYNIKEYTGIDIFEGSIIKAQKKYPNYHFILADFLEYDFKNKFDFLVCSGALTTHLQTDNYLILEAWIKKMWKLSRLGFYFNVLLEQYPNQKSEGLFLYNRQKILEICTRSLPRADLKINVTTEETDELLYEMHLLLYR